MPGHVVTYATVAAAVACWLTWHRYGRTSPHQRLLPTEAALVAAAIGGWVAAAVTWGPLGWPGHLLTWIYLAGAAGGYWWLRRHEAVRAARQRRDDAIAWAARKAEWHRVAHLIGLGDFHLQKVTPTLLGEELLLTSAPGSDLASRVARNSDAIAEKYAHLKGLPYGRVDISTTEYPGQLIIGIRHEDPSVKGIVYHPLTTPWPSRSRPRMPIGSPPRPRIRDPVPVGIIPETGEPMTVTLFDEIGAKAIGVHGATGSGKSTLLNDVRERVTAMTRRRPRPAQRRAHGRRAHLGAAGRGHRLRPRGQRRGRAGQDPRRARVGAATGHRAVRHARRDRAQRVPADPGRPGHRPDDRRGGRGGRQRSRTPGRSWSSWRPSSARAAVCLILATQRATQKQTGGGMVRANLSQVVIGNTNRATESRHATGAEAEIPDISEYSRGRKGYFQIWDPQAKEITARGRTFLLGGAAGRAGLLQAHRGCPQGHQAVLLARTCPDAPRGTPGATPGSTLPKRRAGRERDAGEAGGGPGAQRGRPREAPLSGTGRSPACRPRRWRC